MMSVRVKMRSRTGALKVMADSAGDPGSAGSSSVFAGVEFVRLAGRLGRRGGFRSRPVQPQSRPSLRPPWKPGTIAAYDQPDPATLQRRRHRPALDHRPDDPD